MLFIARMTSSSSRTLGAALKLSPDVIFDLACLTPPKKAPAIAGAFYVIVRCLRGNPLSEVEPDAHIAFASVCKRRKRDHFQREIFKISGIL